MQLTRRKITYISFSLLVFFNIVAWFVSQEYYKSRIEEIIVRETALAQDRASDLADSIGRNLGHVHGIPDLLSQDKPFKNAVLPFGTSSTPSSLPLNIRKQRWTVDAELHASNQKLLSIKNSLNADLIYVVNAAGDCIAASNADEPGSSVGTNFAERDFFHMSKNGQRGMQYAVGKTTHIAGIYFASPIMINGKFFGAVVAKIDVPSLSFLINTLDAFVVDANSVVILAHDKSLEMSALSDTLISSLSDSKRFDIYRKNTFTEFPLKALNDPSFPSLLHQQGRQSPYVLATHDLGKLGIKVYVKSKVTDFYSLKTDSYVFSLLLCFIVSTLILTGIGIVLYIVSMKRSKILLNEQKKQFETFIQATHDAIHVLDQEGRALLVNDAFCNMLGYTQEEMISGKILQRDINVSQEAFNAHFTQLLASGNMIFETRWRRKDGSELSVEISAVIVESEGSKTICCSARDMSARQKFEEELTMASLVLKSSSDGMVVTDENNLIVAVNPAFTKITGYSFEEVKGKNPKIFASGRHNLAFYQSMWKEIQLNGYWQGEVWDRRKNGDIHAKWLTINTVLNADGSVHRHVALFSDITEKKQSEELIWKQANFDTLTGLPNRRMFMDRLQQEVRKSHRSNLSLALFLVDLDQFKEVNDTLGHAVGDLLLTQASLRIADCVREADTVARLGGDEFTVILSELGDDSHVELIAQKIITNLAEPFYLDQEVVYISASVGITIYPNDAEDIEGLVKNADQAMYVAKKHGRNRYSYYTHSLQDAAQNRLRLTTDLRSALEEKQLRVLFQPIVELATGRIHKAEALIRWVHPERGMISPVDFIPLAEESGLIHGIGDWVFKESANWVKKWKDQYVSDFQVSVNKSPVQFRLVNGSGANEWLAYLKEIQLSGRHIVIEITEGLLLNAESDVFKRLLLFRDEGVQVAIDDFGTGYSSLSYLKKFDIDYLKIDQAFVRNLSSDLNDVALCEAIIVMAHKLGLKVIAEGVETEAQKNILAEAGCDYAQGYLFSRPVPPEEFEIMLETIRSK